MVASPAMIFQRNSRNRAISHVCGLGGRDSRPQREPVAVRAETADLALDDLGVARARALRQESRDEIGHPALAGRIVERAREHGEPHRDHGLLVTLHHQHAKPIAEFELRVRQRASARVSGHVEYAERRGGDDGLDLLGRNG